VKDIINTSVLELHLQFWQKSHIWSHRRNVWQYSSVHKKASTNSTHITQQLSFPGTTKFLDCVQLTIKWYTSAFVLYWWC